MLLSLALQLAKSRLNKIEFRTTMRLENQSYTMLMNYVIKFFENEDFCVVQKNNRLWQWLWDQMKHRVLDKSMVKLFVQVGSLDTSPRHETVAVEKNKHIQSISATKRDSNHGFSTSL